MLSSLARLFSPSRSQPHSRRRRASMAGTRAASLSLQQLEQRLALAFSYHQVVLTSNWNISSSANPPNPFVITSTALVVAIDDTVDPVTGAGRHLYMQETGEGIFLLDTSPNFNSQYLRQVPQGLISTILITSSNSTFKSGAPFATPLDNLYWGTTVNADLPAVMGPTSGTFAHAFTFQASTVKPTQRLIVDLSPNGSSIDINSPWNAAGGALGGARGNTADWSGYTFYGSYPGESAGQMALYATNVTVNSPVTATSRFTADAKNNRFSGFTQPVRNVDFEAPLVAGSATTIRVEGTTTTAGLLEVGTGASITSPTLSVYSLGSNIVFEGDVTATNQTYLLNSAAVTPPLVDPNTYTFTTRSQATGLQVGNIYSVGSLGITLGNASGGTIDLRTIVNRLAFQSGSLTGELPPRYAITVQDRMESAPTTNPGAPTSSTLQIDSVGSSSGPIAISTGNGATTIPGDLTIKGSGIQTVGDLALTANGTLNVGTIATANGDVRLQADSLTLDSGVTVGGGRNVAIYTNKGATKINSLARAGGTVMKSVRVASNGNSPLVFTLPTPPNDSVDGVALGNGDRVLLKNQDDPKENGIYVYNSLARTLSRSTDADAAAEFQPGFVVFAIEGTQRGGWVFRNPTQPLFGGGGANPNQTSLSFVPLSAAQTYGDVVAATTGPITLDLASTPTVDNVNLLAGDRVLVKNQANAAENGIYVVAPAGTAWSRAGDANSASTLRAGNYVFVRPGILANANGGTGWVASNDVVQVNTTPLVFESFTQQPPTAAKYWAPATVLNDVAVATTTNIVLSGSQSVDGVLLVGGELVLVKNQIDSTQNGIYVVDKFGAWSRYQLANNGNEVPRGTTVYVSGGTQGKGTAWTFDDSLRLFGATTANDAYVTGLTSTDGLAAGMLVSGEGIPANTTIAQIRDKTSLRLSTIATVTNSATPLTFTKLADTSIVAQQVSTTVVTGVANGTTLTLASTAGLQAGMIVTGGGVVAGTTIAGFPGPNQITLSQNNTVVGGASLTFIAPQVTATTTNVAPLTNVTSVTLGSTTGLQVGMIIAGVGVSAGTKITAINAVTNQINFTPANSFAVGASLGFYVPPAAGAIPAVTTFPTAATTATTTLPLTSTSGLVVGMLVSCPGISTNTTIAAIDAANNRVVLSQPASVTGTDAVTFFPATSMGGTPIVFLPAAGDVSIASATDIGGGSRLQAASAVLVAGIAAGNVTASITAATNVGRLSASTPGAILLDNSTAVELSSVRSTIGGPITVTANGTITATYVNATGTATVPGNVSLTSITGDVVVSQVKSSLGDVTIKSVNANVNLLPGSSVSTTGSVSVYADLGIITVSGSVVAQGLGSDITISTTNGSIIFNSTANLLADDQLKIFAPLLPVTSSSPTVTASRIDWTAAGNLPVPLGKFNSLAVTRTDPGDIVVDVTLTNPGRLTLESASTFDGSIIVKANDLLISGPVFTGDSGTPGTKNITLEAATGGIVIDGDLTATQDVMLRAVAGGVTYTAATATATVSGGQVTGLTVVTPGSGYTSAPAVFVSPPTGPGGVPARATAVIQAGQVLAVLIVDPGSGYTTVPTVTIASPHLITAPRQVTLDAKSSSRLTTKTGRLSNATLTGTAAALNVFEADDLTVGTVLNSNGASSVAIVAGSAAAGGSIAIDDRIDVGATGGVSLVAGLNVLEFSPDAASDIVAGTVMLQALTGKIDVDLAAAGNVTALASTDLNLSNNQDMIVSRLTSGGANPAYLSVQGAITQVGPVSIAQMLDISATGDVRLTDGSNNVASLAISSPGRAISYTDADGFIVTGGGITGDTVTLVTATGNITQAAGANITAASTTANAALSVTATTGSVNLQTGSNNHAASVAIVVAPGQSVQYKDAGGFRVAGIRGGAIALQAAGTVMQSGAVGDAIVGTSLDVTTSAGNVTLNSVNNVNTLAISLSGPVIGRTVGFTDTDGFTIGNGTYGIVGETVALVGGGAISQATTPLDAITATKLSVINTGNAINLNNPNNSGFTVTGGIKGGAVALTSTGPILQGGTAADAILATTSLTVTNTGGAVTLDNAANDTPMVSIGNGTRAVTYADANGFQVAGITGGSVALKAGGAITQALAPTGKLSVSSLSVDNAGNNVTLDNVANGGFRVAGGIKAAAIVIRAAGAIDQDANPGDAIQGSSLQITNVGGSVMLGNASNNVATLQIDNGSSAVTYRDVDDLSVTGITGGAVALTVGGNLSQSGAITTPTSLTVTAGAGNVLLANGGNSVGLFTATSNAAGVAGTGSITFTNASAFSAGPVTAGAVGSGNGSITLTANSGNLGVVGDLTALNDSVTLNAPAGTITFATVPPVSINADILSYSYGSPAPSLPATVPAIVVENGNLTLTNPDPTNTVLVNGYPVTGNITITSTLPAGFQVSGPLTAGAGKTVTLTASAGPIGFRQTGGIYYQNNVNGTTNVSAAGAISDVPGTVISGATVILGAGQDTTLLGQIKAVSLRATATNAASILLGGTNAVDQFTASSVNGGSRGNITLNDTTSGLSLNAITAGTVTINGVGTISQNGVIDATRLDVTGNGGAITLDTQSNKIGTFAATSPGYPVSLKDISTGLLLDGVTGTTVTINGVGAISQIGAINAMALKVTGSGGAITLNAPNNSIDTFTATFAAPSQSYAISLSDTSPGLMLGTVTGTTVTINGVGAITQSGAINATTLDVTSDGSAAIKLDTQNNTLSSFKASNAGGAVFLKDTSAGLALGGIIGGAVTITGVGQIFTTAAIDVGTLDITGNGDVIHITAFNHKIGAFAAANGTGEVAVSDSEGGLQLGDITCGNLYVRAQNTGGAGVTVNGAQVIASRDLIQIDTDGGLTVIGPAPGGLIQCAKTINLQGGNTPSAPGVVGVISLINGGRLVAPSILANNKTVQVGGVVDTSDSLAQAFETINGLSPITGSTYEIVVGSDIAITSGLTASKPITLRGNNDVNYTISNGAKVATGLTITGTASGTTVRNLAFSGFAANGILINGGTSAKPNKVTLSNLTISNSGTTGAGLSFAGSGTSTYFAGSTVQNCTFTNDPYAIRLTSANGVTIGGTAFGQNNRVNGSSKVGVFASGFCTNSSVIRTVFTNTKTPYNTGSSRNLKLVK